MKKITLGSSSRFSNVRNSIDFYTKCACYGKITYFHIALHLQLNKFKNDIEGKKNKHHPIGQYFKCYKWSN